MVARVGNDVIIASDVLASIDDMLGGGRGRTREKYLQQRAMFAQEIMDGINELKVHYRDPDPGKGVSPQHRAIIMQVLQEQIKIKLAYQDFRNTVPKDALPNIEEKLQKLFDENQMKALMTRENVVSLSDLQNALLAKGSSLDHEKRSFKEQVLAGEWMREQLKKDKPDDSGKDDDEEVTHEEMLGWYQAHLKDFEKPARVRWDELMISFTRHTNHDEAYALLAALGNRVLAGASLVDVARSGSEGPTAKEGGRQDWTRKGSVTSDAMDQALFSQPPGQLSPILESPSGYHIIRVVERQEASRTTFSDAQKEIKEKIKKERLEKRKEEINAKLRAKYPVWTVFDNALQQPKPPEEEDRYSRR